MQVFLEEWTSKFIIFKWDLFFVREWILFWEWGKTQVSDQKRLFCSICICCCCLISSSLFSLFFAISFSKSSIFAMGLLLVGYIFIYFPPIFSLLSKHLALEWPGNGLGGAQEGPISRLCAARTPPVRCLPAVNRIVLLLGSHFFWCSWQAGNAQEWPGSGLGVAWEAGRPCPGRA